MIDLFVDRRTACSAARMRVLGMSARASESGRTGGDHEIAGPRRPSRVEELARFVRRARWEQISEPAREQLELRVLDSLGVALGALDGEPVAIFREQVDEFGGAPMCTLCAAASPGRAHARARAARRRGLSYTADGLGRRDGEVRPARRPPCRVPTARTDRRRGQTYRRAASRRAHAPARTSIDCVREPA
jgi:MmgE/PrpD N-terminal domain